MEQKFFLRIPVLKGHKPDFDHAPVDLERLDESVINEVFTRVRLPGDTRSKYVPVVGFRPRAIDASRLLELIQDILQQWQATLDGAGEYGARLWAEHIQTLPFERLVTTLTARQLGGAEEAVRDILYGLMTATTELATALTRHSETVSGMDESNTRLAETLQKSGGIAEDFCLRWGIVVETINRKVAELQQIEQEATAIQDRILRTRDELAQRLSEARGELRDARVFFDGDENRLGFLLQLIKHQTGEEPCTLEDLTASVAQAHEHLRACRDAEGAAQRCWDSLHTSFDGELVKFHARMNEATDQLLNGFREWRDIERQLGTGTMRPYDLGAVEPDEYLAAQAALTDSRWSPRLCRERIGSLLNATIGLLNDRPRLPDGLRTKLEQVESRIASVAPPPQPSPLPAVPTEAGAAIAATRLEEIYTAVCTVGYVVTCNTVPAWQSNLRSLLRVVHRLGWCTTEEFETVFEQLNDRSKLPGEREHVPTMLAVKDRWRESSARWIYYQRGRVWCFKLTRQAGEQSARLILERGIDVAAIQTAKRALRAESQLAYEQRRTALSPGQES